MGRPERPARLGYETFGCGASLTWREAPCRFRKGRRRRPVDMARSAMSVSRDARCARTSNRNTDRQSKRRQSCFSLCSEPGTHGPRIWVVVRPSGSGRRKVSYPGVVFGFWRPKSLVPWGLGVRPPFVAPGGQKSRTLVPFSAPALKKSRTLVLVRASWRLLASKSLVP